MSKNLFALAFGDEEESTPRAAGAFGAQATEETNVSDGASACEMLCTACNDERCALSKELRHKAIVAALPANARWIADEPRNWADMLEEEGAQPVDPWIVILLAAAAAQLEAGVVREEPVFVPFVADPAIAARAADPWARNANGTIMCCRNHAHKGVKGDIAPAEGEFAAGCNAYDAGTPCLGTHEGTPLFGKRFAHIGDDEWGLAQPRESGSRPASAALFGRVTDDRFSCLRTGSGASTPMRSGASTPQRVFTGCLHCKSNGVPMTNHTSNPAFVSPRIKLCGKVERGQMPATH